MSFLDNLVEDVTTKYTSYLEIVGMTYIASQWLNENFDLETDFADVWSNTSCQRTGCDDGYRFDIHDNYVINDEGMSVGGFKIGANGAAYAEIWSDPNHILGYAEMDSNL